MRIVSARWTPRVNMLRIECDCGQLFEHRADRWKPRCPRCQAVGHLVPIRERYLREHSHSQ